MMGEARHCKQAKKVGWRTGGVLLAGLAVLALWSGGGGGALARQAYEFLWGCSLTEVEIAHTRTAVSLDSMMGEGRFHEILYVYDTLFSPDSRWLAFIVDAIPASRVGHHYYVYMLDAVEDERRLLLETKIGPALSASFAWMGSDTPVLFWPEYPEEVVLPPAEGGPAWDRALKVRGQDPRVRPGEGGIAFRRTDGKEASLWYLESPGTRPPVLLSSHCSPFNELRWSPDGAQLAYLSPEGAQFGEALWLVTPGQEPRLLSDLPVAEFFWSPKSDAIAVHTQAEEVVVLDTVTGGERMRLDRARSFVWSPDGAGLACILQPDANDAELLAFASLGGSGPRTLFRSREPGGWDLSAPIFSPDGSRIYVGGAAGSDVTGDGQYFGLADRRLYRCDLRSSAQEVVQVDGSPVRPVVSPDGRYAMMVVERASGSFLWGLELNTGQAVEWGRAPVEKYAYELAWSPNGERAAYEDSLNLIIATLAPKAP